MNEPKRSVLQLDSQLLADAEAAGIDAQVVAARAIRRALEVRDRERIKAEIAQDIAACDAYVAQHGSFAEMMRRFYAQREEDGPASI
jgi:post-segregation antitoxin (ccd killing protein)